MQARTITQPPAGPARQPPRRGRRGRAAAFSLVEMLLVAATVAVVAAIAAPRYSNSLSRYRAQAAAARVAADLALARNRAMTGNATQAVEFRQFRYRLPGVPANNGMALAVGPLTVDLGGSTSGGTPEYLVDLTAEPYHLSAVAADFGGDATVAFDAFGVPDSDGRVVVTCGSVSKTVLLNPRTGRAEVQ